MPGATVTAAGTDGDDNEVVHDFSPLLLVYKSGRVERPVIMPLVPPGHDAATGVESKDVRLSPDSPVSARLYLPPAAAGDNSKLPVVVYFHGGGFVMGSAASCIYHRFVNDLAAACPAVAVSVDYRLAPEHLLPVAYEDSLAALRWVLSGSAAADPWLAARGDLDRVFLAGDSAGGNICHHLAMHPEVRRLGGVRGAVLVHPWFWGTEPVRGEEEHRRSPDKKRAAAAEGGRPAGRKKRPHLWEFVCPSAVDGVDDPRMNPTAPGAPPLEGLACERVMVCVAEGDHLRWRGRAYAEAVARAKGGAGLLPAVSGANGTKPVALASEKGSKPVENGAKPVVASENNGGAEPAATLAKCASEPAVAWANGCGGRQPPAVELFESEGVGHVFYLVDPEMEESKELLGRIAAFVNAK